MEIYCDPMLFQWMGLKKSLGDDNEDLQSILDSSNVKALFSGWKKPGHKVLSWMRDVICRPGWHF